MHDMPLPLRNCAHVSAYALGTALLAEGATGRMKKDMHKADECVFWPIEGAILPCLCTCVSLLMCTSLDGQQFAVHAALIVALTIPGAFSILLVAFLRLLMAFLTD